MSTEHARDCPQLPASLSHPGEVVTVHHTHTSQSGRVITFATVELPGNRVVFQITSQAPNGTRPPFVIRLPQGAVADLRGALEAYERRRVEQHAALPRKRAQRKPWQHEQHTPGVPRGSTTPGEER